jgi:hypothetical protein
VQVEKLTLAARFRRAALPTRQRVPDAGAAAQAARIEATPPDLTPRAYTGRGVRALAAAISLDRLPSSGLSVAALLESRGWTDIDAQRLFGIADVVALGYEAWREAWRAATLERLALQKGRAGAAPAALGGSLHLRGFYFLVLAFIQIAALVLTGFSLGSGSGFTLAQATAAGLGALLGLVWANGFGQLLARDPWSLYLEHARVLAGLAAFRIIGLAMALAIGLAVAALGLCLVSAPSLVATVGLAAVYFLLFALYWLWVNTLLLLDLALTTVFSAVAGLAGMVLLQALWPGRWNPAFAPALGLALANLLMGLVAAAWWGDWWRGSGRPTRPVPRLAGAAVSQLPYLVYGCGVGLLIILDRLIAWHTGAQTGFFEVQPSYDVSSSWALLAFLLAMVGQEWLLAGFLVHLRDRMHRHSVADLAGYRRALSQAYWLRLALGTLIAAASGTAIAWLVGVLAAIPWLQAIVPSGEGSFVLRWGLIGYCLLAVALLNTGLVIGFSRPNRLMLPLALALTADLAVGWTAAQATTYAASVLGLVAGSAVLLVATFPQVLALLSTPVYSLCLDG